MATYVNDLRLKEIATGDEAGTWGTSTNTNLELIAEAFSFGTEAITTNADTHTTTIADGSTDPGRSIFLKYTGTLDSACTITIGPNTVSKLWFIENATSGSQNIIISQGSGANITIPNGHTKAIYSDGAGSGAAMVDAFASLNVVDLSVEDDLTVTDDVTIGGTLGVTGVLTATSLDISGDIDVDGTTNLDVVDIDGAVDMASTLAIADNITQSSGDYIYSGGINFDIKHTGGGQNIVFSTTPSGGSTAEVLRITSTGVLAKETGDFTLDVAGDIVFDADGGDFNFKDGGTTLLSLSNAGSNNVQLSTSISDGDLLIKGNDGGSIITALTLDMSAAGAATFNDLVAANKLSISAADGVRDADYVGSFHNQEATSGRNFGVSIAGGSSSADIALNVVNGAADTVLLRVLGNGAVTSGGNITVGGTNNLIINDSGAIVVGADNDVLISNTGSVFNEDGQDADFRIESDGNANMFVVNAGANGVGIGTDNPGTRELKVNNASNQSDITITSGANQSAQLLFGDQDADNQGIIQYNNNGDTMHFFVDGTERFAIDDGLTFEGKSGTSPIFELINNDNEDTDTGRETSLRFSGHRSGGEDVVNAQISGHHAGSSDNDNGLMIFYTNNGSGLDEKMRLNFDEIIINQNDNDQNLRIESENNANMLLVDAGSDVVCIGGTVAETADHLEVLSSDTNTNLRIRNTNAGAAGPRLIFDKSSASQANDDNIGELLFVGKDSAGNAEQFARLLAESGNVTSGAEDGVVSLEMMVNGTNTQMYIHNHVGTTFNDGGDGDLDFRVEGDSDSHVLFVDATNDTVCFGASAPVGTCNIFTYAGSTPGIQTQNLTTGTTNLVLEVRNNGTSTVGTINATNTATEFNTSSDYRLKENVETLKDGLDRLTQLKPVQFTWKVDNSLSEGFIAHEVEDVFPDAVSGEKDAVDEKGEIKPQQVDYGRITPLLVKAIQEQQEQIQELKAEIATLKGE